MECPGEVEASCPYSAKKIYLDKLVEGHEAKWPLSVVCDIEDHPGKAEIFEK